MPNFCRYWYPCSEVSITSDCRQCIFTVLLSPLLQKNVWPNFNYTLSTDVLFPSLIEFGEVVYMRSWKFDKQKDRPQDRWTTDSRRLHFLSQKQNSLRNTWLSITLHKLFIYTVCHVLCVNVLNIVYLLDFVIMFLNINAFYLISFVLQNVKEW